MTRMVGEYRTIKLTRSEGVARITLNLPPLNIMNIAMMLEINDALETLKGAPGLKALVIASEGKAFSAGVDVSDHTADKVERMIRVFHDIFHNMAAVEAPIVAAVDGAALGGGCELVAACDIVLASERSKFGQPEIQVGVFPPIAAVLFPRIMGRGRALELILTGEVVKADEAHRLGLVTRVLPVEGFAAGVDTFVAKLAALSAPVLHITKRAVDAAQGKAFGPAVECVEELYLKDLMCCEDAHEGLAAFLEKRKPVWKDK